MARTGVSLFHFVSPWFIGSGRIHYGGQTFVLVQNFRPPIVHEGWFYGLILWL
jgi:hypothetical protein